VVIWFVIGLGNGGHWPHFWPVWLLIPARTSPRSSSSVRPTTRPAARMERICSRVLISIPRSLNITARAYSVIVFRAASTRSLTSSISPTPSTSTSRPRWAYTRSNGLVSAL